MRESARTLHPEPCALLQVSYVQSQPQVQYAQQQQPLRSVTPPPQQQVPPATIYTEHVTIYTVQVSIYTVVPTRYVYAWQQPAVQCIQQ